MTAIDVRDLLGTPWEAMDCAAIARETLRRCGLDVPAYAFARAEAGNEEALTAYLTATAAHWQTLGASPAAATQCGDVVVAAAGAGGIHLIVLVDEEGRRAILTSRVSGCQTAPIDRMLRVQKVIRWSP